MNQEPSIDNIKTLFNVSEQGRRLPLSGLITHKHFNMAICQSFTFGKGGQIGTGQVDGRTADGDA